MCISAKSENGTLNPMPATYQYIILQSGPVYSMTIFIVCMNKYSRKYYMNNEYL